MNKKITRVYYPKGSTNSRTFECHIKNVMGGDALLEVSVWEVRPNRKWWQFRTYYFGQYSFWVDDYNTIMDGIDSCLAHLLLKEQEHNERKRKFDELDKTS